MPIISVKRDLLFHRLGKVYDDKEFDELCFQFGIELDDVTTEKMMITKEQGHQHAGEASEDVIYRIDIPANRYDLLCIEGLVRGLLIFQTKMKIPVYRLTAPKNELLNQLKVTSNTESIRKYAVAAVLRNITFSQISLNSFIDLQDKLHQNICRKRSLVAIGTHDLDTLEGPFIYDAKPPKEIKFKPLNQTKEYNGEEIMELYSNHVQLKQYLNIIRWSSKYPIIYDKNGVVLSMPPIINGDHSKITTKTKNVFIECTATDLTKAKIVLDTLVCMFSEYCEDKFTVESVNVVYENGNKYKCPALGSRVDSVAVKQINSYLGINEKSCGVASLLGKMGLRASPLDSGSENLTVQIPATRQDIINKCDIYEDVAIAYGYNNITRVMPPTMTIGKQLPLNKLTDQLREHLAHAGFTEALTFTLCSRDDISKKVGKNFETIPCVEIANPKTLEFQIVRTSLLPGLLKTVAANKKMPLPLKLYEVSDVVVLDKKSDEGACNIRHLCALNYNKTAGFEIIHGLLDRIMQLLEVPLGSDSNDKGYYLRPTQDPQYFPQCCAEVVVNGNVIGKLGSLHPDVLAQFELSLPISCVEIQIESFV